MSEGLPFLVGYSYLVPLQEKVILENTQRMLSSPKSTSGRDFLNCRLLVDYHSEYDEARAVNGLPLDLWLLIQPLAFNVIMWPNLTLNQLRFFEGLDSSLSEREIMEEHSKRPLAYYRDGDKLVPANFNLGKLATSLNLDGGKTSGVAALMARKNPEPIDLNKNYGKLSEDYFEPVLSKNGKITSISGRHYLLSTREVLDIPSHLSAELRKSHHTGIQGSWHFAGFIDNGFQGDLVFELRSDEQSNASLEHGTEVNLIDVYRCKEPSDKVYSKEIGSNYQGQEGLRVSRHFTLFNFKRAGKEYKKLDKLVLVEEKEKLISLRKQREGFEPIEGDGKKIIELCEKGFFLSRYDCEDDEKVLQVIPYTVIFGPNDDVFAYVRSKDIKDYGDQRLFDKYSIGWGGHLIKTDGPNFIQNGLRREVFKEEVKIEKVLREPKIVGTLFSSALPVDKVHYGLVYAMQTDENVRANEASAVHSKWVKLDELNDNPELTKKSETWTRLLIPHLYNIKRHISY